MKTGTKIAALCLGATVLAACNSNSNATTQTAAGMTAMASTGGVNKPRLEALQAMQSNTRSAVADVPTSGSATYNGYAQIFANGTPLGINGTSEVVGVAALEVGFAGNGSMTGTVTNFDDPSGTYTGTLDVTGGAITEANGGKQVRSDIAGTLTRSSGEVFAISGNLTGGFFGSTGQDLIGADKITVTSGGTSTETDIFLNASQ